MGIVSYTNPATGEVFAVLEADEDRLKDRMKWMDCDMKDFERAVVEPGKCLWVPGKETV